MGYIGSEPATNFETVRKQVSTTNSGTTITLDYSVSSVQDILVTVNAVVQSYDNYSVSGTTLTLGGTLNNDRVEILYVGRTFQTVTPAVGTVTNDMLSGSIANSKLANSSVSINGSSVSLGGSITGIGETNQPIWFGRKTNASDQTLSRATKTKITSMTDDEIDTNSAYSSSRFTVPSGEAGKYFIHGCILGIFSTVGNDGEAVYAYIYKNGVEKLTSGFTFDPNGKFTEVYQNVSGILDLAVGDYVELYAQLTDDNASGSAFVNGGVGTNFGGFKISS